MARFPLGDPYRREQIFALSRRSQQVLFFAAATGIVTGAVVAGFEYVTREVVYEELIHAPLWVRCVAPLVGLLCAAFCVKYLSLIHI